MNRPWNIRPATPDLALSLSKSCCVSLPVAQLLIHRGLTEADAIASFLDPRLNALSDPELLPDMDKAVARVLQAIRGKEKIILFGDYDVDGMTSIALLLEVLGKLGGVCGYFIPSRFVEGYGLKMDSVRRCIQDGAKLMISVDCGTNSTEEIRFAKTQGVDFIVLDHHEHNGTPLEAVAVVNPKRKDSVYKEELASVGIAFKLAHALLKSLRAEGEATSLDLKSILDFVAIGTVADMVPLLGENRILVRAGLERFARTGRPGLRILRDLAGLSETSSATDIAFRIAPRLNANGRLSDAQDALSLLCTSSETQAMVLAQRLHQENQRRQQIEKQITQQAIAMVRAKAQYQKDLVLVVYHPDWHIGVVGIVANKLVKEFGKPAVVIGAQDGVGRGSARSAGGFHLVEALAGAGSHLVAYGGHAGAAGLTIDPPCIDAFRRSINQHALKALSDHAPANNLDLDMEISKDQLSGAFVEELSRLEPFGMGNPKPVFATNRISLDGLPLIVGQHHLKFQTHFQNTPFDVMGFRMAERSAGLAGRKLDIAYHPCVNTFNGKRRYQLNLEDFRFSPIAGS